MPSTYSESINAVAIAPVGGSALAGGADRMFAIFPLQGSGGGGLTRRAGGPISAACFTPDGKRAMVAVGQTLFVIDAVSGRIVQRIPTAVRLIAAVAVSPDGKTAATGAYDDTVRIWDLETAMNTKVMTGHVGPVRAVAFLPDGKTLVSASQDNTIRLWDIPSAREIRSLTAHADGACAMAVSPDGSVILSGGTDGTVRKWDLSLPLQYREQLRLSPASLYTTLDRGDDTMALRTLGQWYAFRNRNDWAVECLQRVRAAGGNVSPLLMARCYWKLDRLSDAAREFRDALAQKEAPVAYLELCLSAVSAPVK
jgi:WD40 repeat protein